LNVITLLFEGIIFKKPEFILDGQLGKRGRCEYGYTFTEGTMLLLIELKFDLRYISHEALSNIVAQCCVEADAASLYNSTLDLDHCPVQVVLTDGVVWEFFFFEFPYMCMWRGETNALDGYRDVSPSSPLSMKDSELADEHVDYLKTVTETVFDTFLTAYGYGLGAVLSKLKKQKIQRANHFDTHQEERIATAKSLADEALMELRQANRKRKDPTEADLMAEQGLTKLKQSIALIPNVRAEYLLSKKLHDNWDRIARQ